MLRPHSVGRIHTRDEIGFGKFAWNKCNVVSGMIISKKCSETVVGLEILDGLSTGLRLSLKLSLSRRLASPMYCLRQ